MMKKIGIAVLVLVALIAVAVTYLMEDPEQVAVRDAYIFGYPLVTFDLARRQQTNVPGADDQHAPMGQVIKMRSYPAVDNKCCAAPNTDTLYTLVWLDVAEEPWVITIPDMGDRYYIVPFLDGWSEVFHVASPATTGSAEQVYAVTGPGWTGTLPEGVTQLKSSTGMVWVLGRLYCTGTDQDYAEVHTLQDQFGSVPLSAWGKSYTPSIGGVDPSVDMITGVREQVNSLSLGDYFEYLADLMKTNPPRPEDAAMVERMATFGLVPGQDFDRSKLPKVGRRVDPKISLIEMVLKLKQQHTTNGWLYFTEGVGNFGTDYVIRAMANLLGPGWNRPEDAVYPLSQHDTDGNDYDGSKHRYVMRFEPGALPPAGAFWSVTLYDKEMFFVPNAINRYGLAQRDPLVTGPDGAVELYIQAESPGGEKATNWLPAPQGPFILVMRLYEPAKTPPSILDGSWTPPPAVVVEP